MAIKMEEFGPLLRRKLPGKVTPDPQLPTGGHADYKVRLVGRDVFFEHKDFGDITVDITEKTPYAGKHVTEIDEIPLWIEDPREKKTLLDRIAVKILDACKQLPEGEPDVLVVKASDLRVSCDNITDAMERIPQFLLNERGDIVEITRHSHLPFRTQEAADKVYRRISALIAYEGLCAHGKLKGKFCDNSANAGVPLIPNEKSLLENLICDKC